MLTIKQIEKEIAPILRSHHVKRASLFGSVVHGTPHVKSDIDLLVDMPKNASLLDRARVKVAIEEKLGMSADVLRFDSIQKHARTTILSSQVPLTI